MGIKRGLLVSFFLLIVLLTSNVSADTDVLDVIITEYVSEVIAYDQVYNVVDGAVGNDPDNLAEASGELGENNSGTSRTGVDLHPIIIYGFVNITNVETLGEATLSSINVTFNNTYNITGIEVYSAPNYLQPSDFYVNVSVNRITPGAPNNISIFIPELRSNDSVLLNYTVYGNGTSEPLNFTEIYSFWRVMTGQTVNITLNVSNHFLNNVTIYDLVLTKTPEGYTNVFNVDGYFNYTNLRGEDASNATITWDGSKSVLQWNASAGTLDQLETRQIIFDATAPTNLTYGDINWSAEDDWGLWLRMGNLSADFKMNGSVSGLELTHVESKPTEVRMALSKDRINESWYWNATLNLTNDAVAPIDYNLTQVTVWATKYQEYTDPGSVSTWIPDTVLTATIPHTPNSGVTANATWLLDIPWAQDVSVSNYSIMFNYSLVPIVWADASFIILDAGTQYFKLNESRSEPGGYLFIEEIYVLLGGYLMKVTKTLTPLNETGGEGGLAKNRYQVNITLENVGNEQTPDLVTMFDLLPNTYEPLDWSTRNLINGGERNMTNNPLIMEITTKNAVWESIGYTYPTNADSYILGAADSGDITSGPYAGYWGYHIDFVALNATSNGNGYYDAARPDVEIGIHYVIQGNDSLSRIENAYLIGVDPVRLEGANPSQSVASRLKIASDAFEYIVVVASLVVSIGLLSVGFIYARRK